MLRHGVESQAFGSKFKDLDGGNDAGNGRRTYTKPTPTLFVCGIPDAESSDRVAEVFREDEGFIRCRPVSHHTNGPSKRRMCFIDYDTVTNSSVGMKAHQGHKWDAVDEGLKIDYDDAPSKRMGSDYYEKFWPVAPRKPRVETDEEMWSRLKVEQATADADSRRAAFVPPASSAAGAFAARHRPKAALGAKLQVRRVDGCAGGHPATLASAAEDGDVALGLPPEAACGAAAVAGGHCSADATPPDVQAQPAIPEQSSSVRLVGVGGLLGYGDGSDDSSSDCEAADGGAKRPRLSVPDVLL